MDLQRRELFRRGGGFAVALVACVATSIASFGAVTLQTSANVMAELAFDAHEVYEDPFNTITLDVEFTAPDGSKLRVPAFWAGGKVWKVRYASPIVGTHRYYSVCSVSQDAGLHGVEGTVEVVPYPGQNPFYMHGPIRVADNRRYFEHADGTPFFWLADTWWMGLCHRLHWPDEVQTLAADRKTKGFNVIQIVAGLYPDMHPFDPRGANEAGFPWEAEYARIRPEYFDAADQRLKFLVDQGFSPCIVGAWGYFIPWMGVEKAQQHWRYLIARYGALPVTWCAAGEANLPWYLAEGFPYDDRKQVAEWTEVMRYIRKIDPYHRPLTVHPTGIGRLSSRHATDDEALLDFDMLQTPHAQRAAVEPTVRTTEESYLAKPTMPVIDGEAAYEMLGDSLPTEWTRQMFWLCMTHGAAGHSYGANGIWQCNRHGQPHGPSPQHASGVGYGKIPWDEAMRLPGSAQVALGKKLFERYPWFEFKPHPEWARYADGADQPPEWGRWVWFAEGEPAADAPAGKRYFRKTFELPKGELAKRGTLWISVDDRFTAYVNGRRVGERVDWRTPHKLDVTLALRPGRNVLAIEAENLPAPAAANPAGLLATLQIETGDGAIASIQSDASWKSSREPAPAKSEWTAVEFDDASWGAAKEVAAYSQAPWGAIQSSATYGPYATGMPGSARVIYAPTRRSIEVVQLESGVTYRAFVFNVTNGQSTDLGLVEPDESGAWTVQPPRSSDSEDWVLVLEAGK